LASNDDALLILMRWRYFLRRQTRNTAMPTSRFAFESLDTTQNQQKSLSLWGSRQEIQACLLRLTAALKIHGDGFGFVRKMERMPSTLQHSATESALKLRLTLLKVRMWMIAVSSCATIYFLTMLRLLFRLLKDARRRTSS